MTLIAEKTTYLKDQEKEVVKFYPEPVNILVVDDLPEKLMAYEAILEELGQNIISVRTGEEALKLVLRQEFAVILLDVNMPGMDGFETAMLIRKRKKSAHTPIIFLTAFTDEIRMAQGYATGAVDYLPTPVVPEILQAKVRVFIELSQMRRQAALQAEEYAMRKAAEYSARRLEFLVNASEVFARTQEQKEIMQSLIRLSVPYLADVSGVWTRERQTGQLKLYGLNINGEITSDLLKVPPILSSLEKNIHETLEAGYARVIDDVREALPLPGGKQYVGKRYNAESGATVILVPFAVREQLNSVFVLISRKARKNDAAATLSLANDLTSRAGIALENAILVEKIKEADRRKDEFLAMLAHELRNPLAPIKNAVNILKMNSDQTIRGQLEDIIERQADHMVHLVDDLMDVSRITQGKIDLHKERVTLQDAIQHAVETSDPLIKEHRHKLVINLPENAIWIDADFSRLSQIFSNLLNNAAKYTNDNGIIQVSIRETSSLVAVSVKDNGIGIPENMHQGIFDIFSQVDSSLERSQGGLGIGLTLVKKLVEMHGGTIHVSSSGFGTGSEFTVTLPILARQEESVNNAAAFPKETTPVRQLKVLIVDDNASLAQVMKWTIEILGHHIQIAYDGISAIRLAREYRPEIVLMDIGMPGMNGYEICKAMKKDPLLSHTVFVAQTGWGQTEHRERSEEAGFDYHLVKPVNTHDLQRIMNNYDKEIITSNAIADASVIKNYCLSGGSGRGT